MGKAIVFLHNRVCRGPENAPFFPFPQPVQIRFPQLFRLWKTPVENPVENVENYGFSTSIAIFPPFPVFRQGGGLLWEFCGKAAAPAGCICRRAGKGTQSNDFFFSGIRPVSIGPGTRNPPNFCETFPKHLCIKQMNRGMLFL